MTETEAKVFKIENPLTIVNGYIMAMQLLTLNECIYILKNSKN